ncbi:NAD-dependent DNA ligase [Hirudovirus strain Sangsue]|nr:NAD-dependent DNA ligase [Hirudovirus strain Sangsue]
MDIIKKIKKSKSLWAILPSLNATDIEEALLVSSEYYHNTGTSLISDQDYDILMDRLKELNPSSKIFAQVGAPVKGKKVKLPFWMGSMNKIKADEKAVNKWLNEYSGPYVIGDKLDGISCLLTIKNNKIKLYTRGDGTYGQDITHLLGLINIDIGLLEEIDQDIAIRGELIMSKKNFEKYQEIMANARNMVGGIVNSKPESVNKDHAADVDLIFYEVIKPNDKLSRQLKILKEWGLKVVYYNIYKTFDVNILESVLSERKKKSGYEIDGIIVTDNNKHVRNISGNPSYSFAFKGDTPTIDTVVKRVIWTPSKDGVLVPRIKFKKVRLSNVDLEYTTGFNAKYIVDNKIGSGAIINVVRSGDVIPYITHVVKPAKKPDLPNIEYVWDKNGVNIILADINDNETVIIKRLTKFMRNIGAENISEGITTRLVEAGFDTIPKIINMTEEDFLTIDGFQERLAEKIYNNLQNSLDNLDILTLMDASNIFGRGFGTKKFKKILDVYPNIVNQYTKETDNIWRKKLLDIEGFDTITVNKFLGEMPNFQKFYKVTNKTITIKPYISEINSEGIFQNQTVVFTGFRNADWQKFIENEGGKVSGSVSKNTSLLVYNDGEESSAKYQKAKQLGIKTMTKSSFSKKFEK